MFEKGSGILRMVKIVPRVELPSAFGLPHTIWKEHRGHDSIVVDKRHHPSIERGILAATDCSQVHLAFIHEVVKDIASGGRT
jgi:hypothetical protein